jgi:hypothetical protein
MGKIDVGSENYDAARGRGQKSDEWCCRRLWTSSGLLLSVEMNLDEELAGRAQSERMQALAELYSSGIMDVNRLEP